MNINEWLETKDIDPIDDKTLNAIEGFIRGSQLAISMESLEVAKDHYAFIRENALTRREQFAGFALIGLAGEIDKYANVGDMKLDIDALADMMVTDE